METFLDYKVSIRETSQHYLGMTVNVKYVAKHFSFFTIPTHLITRTVLNYPRNVTFAKN